MANQTSLSPTSEITQQFASDFAVRDAPTQMPPLEAMGVPVVASASRGGDEPIVVTLSPGSVAGTTGAVAISQNGHNEGKAQHPRPGAPTFSVQEYRTPPSSPSSEGRPDNISASALSDDELEAMSDSVSSVGSAYSAIQPEATDAPDPQLLEFANMNDDDKLAKAKEIGFDTLKSKLKVKLTKKVFGKDFSTIQREIEAIDSKEKKAKDVLKDCENDRKLLRAERREMARMKRQHRLAQFLQGEYRNNPLFAARVDRADQPSPEVQRLLMNGICLVCKTARAASTCNPCGDRVLCKDCARRTNLKTCPACRKACSITVDKTYNFLPSSTPVDA